MSFFNLKLAKLNITLRGIRYIVRWFTQCVGYNNYIMLDRQFEKPFGDEWLFMVLHM